MTNPGSITTGRLRSGWSKRDCSIKNLGFSRMRMISCKERRKRIDPIVYLIVTKAEKAGIGMRAVEEAMQESVRKMVGESWFEEFTCDWWLRIYRVQFHSFARRRMAVSKRSLIMTSRLTAGNPENLQDLKSIMRINLSKQTSVIKERFSMLLKNFKLMRLLTLPQKAMLTVRLMDLNLLCRLML